MKRTVFAFLTGVITLGILTGCDTKNDNTTMPVSSFGVVNASPDAGPVDIYANGSIVVTNFPYGSDTGYYAVQSGTYNIKAAQTGATNYLIDENISMSPGIAYSIFTIDSVSNLKTAVVQDNFTTPPADSVRIRFFHFSPNAPAVDVALQGGNVLFSNRSFNDQSNNADFMQFSTIAASTYNLELRSAGSSTVVLPLPGISLEGGKVYTIYAKGFAGGIGAQALSAGTLIHNE